MVKKTLRLYISISFLLSLASSFFFATYTIFLTTRGMDLLQISLINAFFMAGIFIMEIPTGAFADIFGRKKSIVLGCFTLSLSMLVYFFSNNFWFFVLAEIIGALSVTFLSGAMEAWAVDSLKFHGYAGEFEHVFKRESQFRQLGIIFGSLSGAYIGNFNIAFPWLASSIGAFIVGLLCLVKLKEEYFISKKFELNLKPIGRIARDSIIYGFKNKPVFYVIIFAAVLSFSVQAFNMQWPLVFKNTYDLSVSSLGWIFVGISLFIMLGNQLSLVFKKIFREEKNAIILSQTVTFLGMMLASTMFSLFPVIIGFFVHEIGRGMLTPIKQTYLNRRITSEKRATVLSFDSMITTGGAISGLIISGLIARSYSISLAWLVSSLILASSIPIFLILKNKRES